MIKTFQYRVKDASRTKYLNRAARAVNMVWWFCNDTQKTAFKWGRKWPTGFDLNKLTTGSGKDLGLHSQTVQAVCETYAARRSERKRPYLRNRGKKHLGWIPFKASGIKHEGDRFTYCGRTYRVWYSRPLEGKVKTGSFSQDAQGHWYINLTCEVDVPQREIGIKELGIDLGLNEFAAFSDEAIENVEAQRFYRDLEPALAVAQRAHKGRQVKAIHAKISNRRKDFLHKLSTRILREYGFICIGNVNSKQLAQTRMAKSVHDAGWSMFRTMCAYKAVAHRAYVQVDTDESFSTQDCNVCDARTGPKGLSGLGIREWTCSNCGTAHHRDRNSAKNILRRGRATLAGGIIVPSGR
jgi:IS605 OrfB family transposase